MNDIYNTESLDTLSQLLQCDSSTEETENGQVNPLLIGSRITSATHAKNCSVVYDYSNKDIWTHDEIKDMTEVSSHYHYGHHNDTRQRPEYSFQYGMDVRTEDVYLGLGGKINSIQHADELIIKLNLPLVITKDEVSIDVTNKSVLELRSKYYLLTLPLPNEVLNDKGIAMWDPVLHVLTMKLPLKKMFSF